MEARLGEAKISVFDTVTNEGFLPTPHMILYHINAGFPVIDEGSQLVAPSRTVTPRDEDARPGLQEYDHFTAPIPNYREQVFFHEMQAASDGYVTAALVNPAFDNGQGFGFYVRYRQKELPCFNQWKMMGRVGLRGGDGAGYELGLRARQRARTGCFANPAARRAAQLPP